MERSFTQDEKQDVERILQITGCLPLAWVLVAKSPHFNWFIALGDFQAAYQAAPMAITLYQGDDNLAKMVQIQKTIAEILVMDKDYEAAEDALRQLLQVAALREKCPWLVTFNVRHDQPGHSDIKILRPGEFVLQVREQLAQLNSGK